MYQNVHKHSFGLTSSQHRLGEVPQPNQASFWFMAGNPFAARPAPQRSQLPLAPSKQDWCDVVWWGNFKKTVQAEVVRDYMALAPPLFDDNDALHLKNWYQQQKCLQSSALQAFGSAQAFDGNKTHCHCPSTHPLWRLSPEKCASVQQNMALNGDLCLMNYCSQIMIKKHKALLWAQDRRFKLFQQKYKTMAMPSNGDDCSNNKTLHPPELAIDWQWFVAEVWKQLGNVPQSSADWRRVGERWCDTLIYLTCNDLQAKHSLLQACTLPKPIGWLPYDLERFSLKIGRYFDVPCHQVPIPCFGKRDADHVLEATNCLVQTMRLGAAPTPQASVVKTYFADNLPIFWNGLQLYGSQHRLNAVLNQQLDILRHEITCYMGGFNEKKVQWEWVPLNVLDNFFNHVSDFFKQELNFCTQQESILQRNLAKQQQQLEEIWRSCVHPNDAVVASQ